MIFKSPSSQRIRRLRRQPGTPGVSNGRLDLPHFHDIFRPHFDPTNRQDITQFLDYLQGQLTQDEIEDQLIALHMQQLLMVLRDARERDIEAWPKLVQRCRQHRLFEVLCEDLFVRRAYEKPRGYPGDAVLMDYIYDNEMHRPPPQMSPAGTRLHRWTTNSPASNGVKERRALIAELIDETARSTPCPEILSIACGHLREAEISSAVLRHRIHRFVAIDADATSIDVVAQDYGRYGIEAVNARAREIVTGRIDCGRFDLIYCAGLFDYLADAACIQLVSRWFQMLNPGGRLLLTNFLPDVEGAGFMEAFMDWNLIYRNRRQMAALTEAVDEIDVAYANAFAERNCNVICLVLEKYF